MPAAVLVGGLVAIAFAFAAISAALMLRSLVVDPIRAAAAAASEVAIVGGVIAWVLTQLANIIEIGLGGMTYLADAGKQQAADWWNYLINQTVYYQFLSAWNSVSFYENMWPVINSVLNAFPGLQSLVIHSIAPTVNATASSLSQLQAFVHGQESQTINAINQDLITLHNWIDGYELPLIRGIGNDLAGLRSWIDSNVVQRSQVGQIESQALAQAQALVAPIAAAVTAIEDSPCMKACAPLGDLGQLIQGLEDAGLLAILLALIAETRSNPQAVQSALRTVIVPIVTDAATTIGIRQ